MTEEKLRNTLKEAQDKGQVGLLIWSCWRLWDELGFRIGPGQEHFDFALSQTQKGEEGTIPFDFCGFNMAGIIAVPVQKLLSSNEFFLHVLNECQLHHFEGPITLIPLNELSESC